MLYLGHEETVVMERQWEEVEGERHSVGVAGNNLLNHWPAGLAERALQIKVCLNPFNTAPPHR